MKVHIVSYNFGAIFFSKSKIHILPIYGLQNSYNDVVHTCNLLRYIIVEWKSICLLVLQIYNWQNPNQSC